VFRGGNPPVGGWREGVIELPKGEANTLEKQKKTSAELAKMIQDKLDPMHERGTVRIGPKAAPNAGWIITVSGSSTDSSLLFDAQKVVEELSAVYELDD